MSLMRLCGDSMGNREIVLQDFYDITEVCRLFSATISFEYTNRGSEVDVQTREITIDLTETTDLNWLWSLVFHEICHIRCLDEGKYLIYHEDNWSPEFMAKYVRRMGLRIERYVDRMGEEMMATYMPDLEYKHSYLDQAGIDFFNKWVEEEYPL